MTAIEISDELAAVLKTKAAAHGLTVDTWLKKLVAENAAPESEQEENAKLEWLRAAAKEGFDAIEKDDCVALISDEEINMFMRRIHNDVKAELAAKCRIS
jgi:hypothetical protein